MHTFITRDRFTYAAKVILLGLILSLGIQFAWSWTNPTVAPPGDNAVAPITTTNNPLDYQTRGAGLGLSGSLHVINVATQDNFIATPKLCISTNGAEVNCVQEDIASKTYVDNAVTAAMPSGSWCGMVTYYEPIGDNMPSMSNLAPCMGVNICEGSYFLPGQQPACGCPVGFTFKKGSTGSEGSLATCIKN